MDSIPVSVIGAFIDFLVLAFFYYKLTNVKLSDNKLLYLFSRFTLFFSIFYLLFSVPILLAPFIDNYSFYIGLGYLIGHISAYVSFGYLARIWMFMGNVNLDPKKVFYGYLGAGAFLTVLNAILFNYPEVLDSGVVTWNQHFPVGPLIILLGLTVFLPSAFFFIRQGVKNSFQRRRNILIGLSFLFIIAGGPLHDVARTAGMNIIADVITTTGFVLMFASLLSKVKRDSKTKEAKNV